MLFVVKHVLLKGQEWNMKTCGMISTEKDYTSAPREFGIQLQ